MSGTNPRLPAVRREPPPDAYDVEVSMCVRVWDGPHGEYHRFEFVAQRQRDYGIGDDPRGGVIQAGTVRAFDAASDEVVSEARTLLARAYPQP